MRFLQEDTVLVVIDVQEKLFPHIYENSFLKKNLEIIIKAFKALEVPIMYTQQYTKGLGETIKAIQNLSIWEFQPIEKMAFSCADEVNFMEKLESLNKKNVILVGIETHVCVMQTALDLIASSYNVMVVEDCVSSRTSQNKQIALKRMTSEGVKLGSYESIILELCRYSGTDTFKQISQLIK
jgi:nicotinamidase-related amidase